MNELVSWRLLSAHISALVGHKRAIYRTKNRRKFVQQLCSYAIRDFLF